jgi:hypothetical protein
MQAHCMFTEKEMRMDGTQSLPPTWCHYSSITRIKATESTQLAQLQFTSGSKTNSNRFMDAKKVYDRMIMWMCLQRIWLSKSIKVNCSIGGYPFV